MDEIRHILVPTGLEESEISALTFAMEVALRAKAEIFLLHPEPAPDTTMHVAGLQPAMDPRTVQTRKAHQNEFLLIVDEISRQGITVHPILIGDSEREDSRSWIKPLAIDLVVTAAMSGRVPVMGLSYIATLLRDSEVPVVVVPEMDMSHYRPESILFASTFRHDQTRAIRQLTVFARLFGSQVDIFFLNHVNHLIIESVAREKVQEVIKLFPDIPFTVNVIDTNDDQWAVGTMIERVHTDVLALTMEHRSWLGRRLDPAFAERMLKHLALPMLVLHNGAGD